MKRFIKFSVMVLGTFLTLGGATQQAKAQYDDVSLQTFYDELSPYGTWINDPQYGYVWRPDVDQNEFRPYYSNGRWAMTEYGNTWVSNYDWGWAPFHYGRWIYTRYNRWIWIPDTEWGPAWVSWRSGGGYYGWAPMGPSVSVNINIGFPDFYWNFVPVGRIYYNNFPRYYSGRNRVYVQNTVIINNTYIHNNRTYYTGPRVADIRRATNQQVTIYNINRTTNIKGTNRIDNNRINIYTPRPNRGSENVRPEPRQVVQANIKSDRVNSGVVSRASRDNNSFNMDNNRGVRREDGRVDDSNIRRGNAIDNNIDRATRPTNDMQRPARTPLFGDKPIQSTPAEQTNTGKPTERVPRTIMSNPPSAERPTRQAVEAPQRMSRGQEQRVERVESSRRGQEQRVERVESSRRESRGGNVNVGEIKQSGRGERSGRN